VDILASREESRSIQLPTQFTIFWTRFVVRIRWISFIMFSYSCKATDKLPTFLRDFRLTTLRTWQ